MAPSTQQEKSDNRFLCHQSIHDDIVNRTRNRILDDFDKEIMKKENWTRLELLAIIAQKRSESSVETPTSEINVNDLEEKDKPGCFGAIGLGQHQEYRNCRKPMGCQWEPRCRQSQEDY